MPRRNSKVNDPRCKRPHTYGGGKRWKFPNSKTINRLEREVDRWRKMYVRRSVSSS